MRVSLYKIVIDIGVCGGHNHKGDFPVDCQHKYKGADNGNNCLLYTSRCV